MQRKFLEIRLNDRTITEHVRTGVDLIAAGRDLIAKTLLERNAATVDPLGPDNPLIFSVGPFAGSNFSNANRTSVGCRSPLTGGVKESNGGGSFGFALGQLEICGFTLLGQADDWVVLHLRKDGSIGFDSATPYLGKGNFEAARLLHEHYGNKVSLGLCGPVGEYQGLLAGIAFSDTDRRPTRLAARGGVGAVLGSKRVKAIVVDMHRLPSFHDRKKTLDAVRNYGDLIRKDPIAAGLRERGTAMMADLTNQVGGLPVENFRRGRLVDTSIEPLRMGGSYIRDLNSARGGETAHACMPGCLIQCSNVYAGPDGKEIASPIEYETLCLLGTNCGVYDPDDLARLNAIVNDLGVDSIEAGATLGVLLDAGLAQFGDIAFLTEALREIGTGTERGRLLAQGTARVGAHYGVRRVPVIKRQAISAYDPRVIEVTGLSMMLTAQGADHTTGNLASYDCTGKDARELVTASIGVQIATAAIDSVGLCVFGRNVWNEHPDLILSAFNDAVGTNIDAAFLHDLGLRTLRYEQQFNRAAGFTESDDDLPEFFYTEALPPSGKVARIHGAEARRIADELLQDD